MRIIFSSILTNLSQDKKLQYLFEDYGLIEKDFSKILSNILEKNVLNDIEAETIDYFFDYNFKYFVETDCLTQAYNILKNNHIILIQGAPGIGKTTTCAILGNIFLNNSENNFYIITRKIENIDEVLTLYNKNYRNNENRQLFVVFDDFLGRNKFDVGDRVLQDVKKLYSAAKNTNNLFICLNSRTQILKKAENKNSEFQKLIDEKFDDEKNIIIDLSTYSDIEKANIFRKTFEKKRSKLLEDDKKELTEKYNSLIGKNWKRIIQHDSYFPRLIELIVDNFADSKSDFFESIIYFLDNPSELYNNLFENLLSEEKYLLFSLLMFDVYPIPEEWLEKSFNILDENPTFDLEKSLQSLDGSWISFWKDSFGSASKVDFLNPSIIDFLKNKIRKLPNMEKKIMNKSIYLHQNYITNSKTRVDFFNRVLNYWDRFNDKSDFEGERIVALLEKENDVDSIEIKSLLKKYDGRWSLSIFDNGWEEVIDAIYYSEDIDLKLYFREMLDDDKFVCSIVNSHKLNSECLDGIVDKISCILRELSCYDFDDEESDRTFSVEELELYHIFRDKKIDIVQENIDNFDDFDTILYEYSYDQEEEELHIDDILWEFQLDEYISNQFNGIYKWKDIEHDFDFDLVNDYFYDWAFDEIMADNAYNLYREEIKETDFKETIESILNKTLS